MSRTAKPMKGLGERLVDMLTRLDRGLRVEFVDLEQTEAASLR